MLERRPDPEDLGVGLALDQRWEAVAGRAADADAVRLVAFEQPDAARGVERVVAGPLQVVRQLLDPRLVGDRRERVGAAGPRLGRVLGVVAVDLVELLRLRVVRLELVVRDRPRRRDSVVVAQLAEVLAPEPVQRRTVELRLAADVVVDARLEGLALLVVPRLLRDVAVLDEDLVGVPVLDLARQPVAALEDEDPLARRREVARQRPAAGAAADDDDVVVGVAAHAEPPLRSARAAGVVVRSSSSSRPSRSGPSSLRSSTCGPRVLPK